MHKVLFVCHGNICRSPMGQYVLQDMVNKAGLSEQFHIASVAVSREELGNPVYPPARREMNRHGVACDGHRARQITQADVDGYDHIYYMDSSNYRYLQRLFPGETKFKPFLSRCGRPLVHRRFHPDLGRHRRGLHPHFKGAE